MPRNSKVFFFALVFICGLSSTILMYSTTHGAGLYYDSLDYITSAENFVKGYGLGRENCLEMKPMTLFPPAYPIALASGMFIGEKPLEYSRTLDVILLFVNTLFVGLLSYRICKNTWFALTSSILFGFAATTIKVFSWAMAEPLYMFFVLSSLLLASAYLNTNKSSFLVLTALLVGLSMVTRYIGISLALAVTIVIASEATLSVRRRLHDVLLFFLISVPPLAIWLMRNVFLVGSPDKRILGVYLPDAMTVRDFSYTVIAWFIPLVPIIRMRWMAIILVAVCVGFLFLWQWFRETTNQKLHAYRQAKLVMLASLMHLLIVIGYILFLLPRIPLDNRILFPLFTAIIILLPSMLAIAISSRKVAPAVALSLILLSLGVQQFQSLPPTVRLLHKDGQGYANSRWQKSETAQALKQQHLDIIFTNDITAVYFSAGLPSCSIPSKKDLNKLSAIQKELLESDGALAIFGELSAEFMPQSELLQRFPLVELYADGAIYRVEK